MLAKLPVEIAVARRSDARAIALVHAESWRTNYRGALSDSFLDGDVVGNRIDLWHERLATPPENQRVFVARRRVEPAGESAREPTIIGFACAYFSDDQQWGTLLDNLHVVPDAQRQGVGAALLAAVAGWSHRRDRRAGLYLWVLEQNQKAQQFYKRLGAVDVGGDVWSPPGGGSVRRRRYAWRELEQLES